MSELNSFATHMLALAKAQGGHRRNMSLGISDGTEMMALPYVYRNVTDVKSYRIATRLVGIIGLNSDLISPSGPMGFGASMRQLCLKLTGDYPEPGSDDRVTKSLNLMQNQRVDELAVDMSRLIRLATSKDVPVSIQAVANTLQYWGSGVTMASAKARRRMLSDYYTPTSETMPQEAAA